MDGVSVERISSPERSLAASHFCGLHGRLLLGGEALNPQKNISDITKDSFVSLENRDYQPFSKASTAERRRTALVEKDKLPNAIDEWAAKTVSVVKQDFSKVKGFDSQKAQRWQQSLVKLLGVSQLDEVDSGRIKDLYQKYFGQGESDVKGFVKDVLAGFENNLEELEKNIDCIEWLSKIFGGQSSQMIRELVRAEATLIKKPDELVAKLNEVQNDSPRINKINPDEEKILRFVWQSQENHQVAKPEVDLDKNSYFELKNYYVNLLTTKDLLRINQELAFLGLERVDQSGLDALRNNEEARKDFVTKVVLAVKRIDYENEIVEIVEQKLKAYQDLPEGDRQAYDYHYLLLGKKGNEELLTAKPDGMTDEEYIIAKSEATQMLLDIETEIAALPQDIKDKVEGGEIKIEDIIRKIKEACQTALSAKSSDIDQIIEHLRGRIARWEAKTQ